MESVIVTIKRKGESQVRDLEVPVEITAEALIQEVALALGWGGLYEIYAVPPERVLTPQETLAQAGVWDGSWLVFQPQVNVAAPNTPSPFASVPVTPPPAGSPVGGWRPLDATPPAAPPPSSAPSSGGFTWKKIDED